MCEDGEAIVIDGSRPFLVVYVVWHPGFEEGRLIAEAVREHFRRRIFENVSGGTGVSVIYRFAEAEGASARLPISLSEAETTAIVVLMESNLASEDAWAEYVHELVERTEGSGLGTRLFPVSIEAEAMASLGLAEQALRWDGWSGSSEQRQQQLVGRLTYEFCRMLRHYLEHLRRPAEAQDALGRPLSRHSPDDIQIRGRRTTDPPPWELRTLRSPPMRRLWRADQVRNAIWQSIPPSRRTSPIVFTSPLISSAYAGTGLGRRSSIKPKIFWNKLLGTATSANWNVTYRP